MCLRDLFDAKRHEQMATTYLRAIGSDMHYIQTRDSSSELKSDIFFGGRGFWIASLKDRPVPHQNSGPCQHQNLYCKIYSEARL